ncbi:uncharacterized protein [Diabrotica undecimpunctata]|uniref:uncharacterized protein n=1 Tax=Diabrotica undecimpunctata TaxID=50387 RepID=UPI003B63E7F3
MHYSRKIDPETDKPEIILDYNSTKGAVDTVDQICSSYTTQRITRRWPLALFFKILDIASINSKIIYDANNESQKLIRRRKYLNDLAFELMGSHLKKRAQLNKLLSDIQTILQKYRGNVQDNNTIDNTRKK